MNAILVDDEQLMLDELSYFLSQYPDIKIAAQFTHALRAVEYMEGLHKGGSFIPDVVFMDIDMPNVNGLDAAFRIQALFPDIIIVFVTAYSSYALDSFKVHPLDYVLKPVKKSQFDATVNHIRRQVQLLEDERRKRQKPVYINCFGHFSIFIGGERADIKWGTHRVMELFMYLIDKFGEKVTRYELINEIFGGIDDKKAANNLYVTTHMLRSILSGIDPEGRYLRLTEGLSLQVEQGVCDYIDFMDFVKNNGIINLQNADRAAALLKLCCNSYLEGYNVQWAIQTSNYIEIEYERISISLATFYASAGRFKDAETVLLNLIMRNPLAEEAYAMLLDQYIELEKHDDFIIIYKQYANVMKKDLGQKPSSKYTLHYKKIKQA